MTRSPLAGMFGQIAILFVVVGILAGIMFHPGAFVACIIAIFAVLFVFNSIEGGIRNRAIRQQRYSNKLKRSRRKT